MRFYLPFVATTALFSLAIANKCECDAGDTECLQSCVTSTNKCLVDCGKDNACYTSCLNGWPGADKAPQNYLKQSADSSASPNNESPMPSATNMPSNMPAMPSGMDNASGMVNGMSVPTGYFSGSFPSATMSNGKRVGMSSAPFGMATMGSNQRWNPASNAAEQTAIKQVGAAVTVLTMIQANNYQRAEDIIDTGDDRRPQFLAVPRLSERRHSHILSTASARRLSGTSMTSDKEKIQVFSNHFYGLSRTTTKSYDYSNTVGRRLLNGITSSMRAKSAYSKQVYPRYAAPSIGSASEETASDSSFSGDLTEACLSDQHQEQYNSDVEDSDKDAYSTCRSVHSEQSSSYPCSSSSVYQRSIRTTGESSDSRPKKTLMSLFQPSNASRRGSVASETESTITGQPLYSCSGSKYADPYLPSTPRMQRIKDSNRNCLNSNDLPASPKEEHTNKDTESSSRPLKRTSVQTLTSPYTRNTSIRMVSESLSRYSVNLPTDVTISPDTSESTTPDPSHDRKLSSSSIESFMKNAFRSDMDLLDNADFTFAFPPILDEPETCSRRSSADIPIRLSEYRPRAETADSIIKSDDDDDISIKDRHLHAPAPSHRRSSIIQIFSPSSSTPNNLISSLVSKSEKENHSESSSRRLMPLTNNKSVASLPTLSRQATPTLQPEIAEPTFVRSRASSLHTRELTSSISLCSDFIELGSDFLGFGTKRIKHFKSESDLLKLKDALRPTQINLDDVIERGSIREDSNLMDSLHIVQDTIGDSDTRSERTHMSHQSNNGLFEAETLLAKLRLRRPAQASSTSHNRQISEIFVPSGVPLSPTSPWLRHGAGSEGNVLHVLEDGNEVLIMEMVFGKLQVVAGTAERLFIKLADETAQEATPGEAEYFEKWQRTIQVKVLSVLSRWLKLQYEDFHYNDILLQRLEAFLSGDIQRAGFTAEAKLLKESIKMQSVRHARPGHTLITLSADPLLGSEHQQGSYSSPNTPIPKSPTRSASSSRRPSGASSIFSFVTSITTPPESPTLPNVSSSSLISFESKELAQYLTLADFYYFKCISSFEYLNGSWRTGAQMNDSTECTSYPAHSYVHKMTKRANMASIEIWKPIY
ncbi:hypothetical protein NQZ79_g4867 [Umbelopsis isabellina]|nr:hypothetical protein NQZ79_g4867 [Umbelopsis isabellina]